MNRSGVYSGLAALLRRSQECSSTDMCAYCVDPSGHITFNTTPLSEMGVDSTLYFPLYLQKALLCAS